MSKEGVKNTIGCAAVCFVACFVVMFGMLCYCITKGL